MRVTKRQLRRIIREEVKACPATDELGCPPQLSEGDAFEPYGKLYDDLEMLQDDIRETLDDETLDMVLRKTRGSSDPVDRALHALALDVKKFHASMR